MIIQRTGFPQNIEQHRSEQERGIAMSAIATPTGAVIVATETTTTYFGTDGSILAYPTRIEMDPLERGER